WTKGTATQVDLAACLADKTTCNAQDASEAPWNDGTWLSAVRYATHVQTSVAPGQLGTFAYNVKAPAGVAAGTYRFNGDLVLSVTGERIHPEGYFQDATVSVSGTAATLTSLNPTSGSDKGGTSVTITGTGFVCNPTLPTVNFGANTATVTSCGSTQVVATSPAGTLGTTVDVTVTNSGAPASNALQFTYTDTTRPTFDSVSASGNTATLTFSEPVCETSDLVTGTADISITVNGVQRNVTSNSAPLCNAAFDNGVSSFNVTFDGAFLVSGDAVSVTLTTSGAAKLRDKAGNFASAQTRTTTGTPDTTKPSMASAKATSATNLEITYSEAVTCNNIDDDQHVVTPSGGSAVNPTALACSTLPAGSTTVNVTYPAGTFAAGVSGSVTYTQSATAANRVKDRVGNDATSPQTISYTAFQTDTTPPTITDARLTLNANSSDVDTGDVWTITFSEAMAPIVTTDSITVQDGDGTSGTVTCNASTASGSGGATCTLNSTATVLTVTITGTLTSSGGTAPGISYPATIIATSGITDPAGNAPNLAGSADRVIDVE
ncbi:MAG: IPT/TIG domain-containing protein, partial [Thermoleophilaceae bacterium]